MEENKVQETTEQKEKKAKKKRFEKKLVVPTKKQINFASVGVVKVKYYILLPSIVLIVVGASLLSKFFVVDRIMEVSQLQAEVATLQGQVDSEQAAIDAMGDLAIKYAHYTWTGMTDEEKNLSDRMDAVELIEKYVRTHAKVGSYTISGNEISLPITGVTFNEIGKIVNKLETDPLVEHCEVIAAASDDSGIIYNTENVGKTYMAGDMDATAQVTIYLIDSSKETEQ